MGGGASGRYRGLDDSLGETAPEGAPLTVANRDIGRLRRALETDYASLLHRLTGALRSHDRAAEALHDAYARLGGNVEVGEVRNPVAYLYRMALNLAHNVRRHDLRMVSAPPALVDALYDDSPGPERVAIANHDLDKALRALSALPEQRRKIFLARWRDGLTHEQIAAGFSLHKRTVQKELARAERHLRSTILFD